MALAKSNEMGMISLSNGIIAKILDNSVKQPDTLNFIWIAGGSGKEVGTINRITNYEFLSNFKIQYSKKLDGKMVLHFGIIIKFGVSIKKYTKLVADYIREELINTCGDGPAKIIIDISGVRTSQTTAKRSTRVIYEYEDN